MRISELSTIGMCYDLRLDTKNQDGAELKNGHTLEDAKLTLTTGSSAFSLYLVLLRMFSLRPPPPGMF